MGIIQNLRTAFGGIMALIFQSGIVELVVLLLFVIIVETVA
jgi:hypothetical protein